MTLNYNEGSPERTGLDDVPIEEIVGNVSEVAEAGSSQFEQIVVSEPYEPRPDEIKAGQY